MKRSLAVVLAGLIVAGAAYAGPQAVLSGLKGKVEVKSSQGNWTPASNGMKLDLKWTISTGFDSTATINIEKSKIVVKPLTRLTLDKLIEQSSGSVAASLFLRVGAVQASVKATNPGTPQDFKVQSPYSTASVRGTDFEFDGLHLAVFDGVVSLIPGRPVRDIQPDAPPPPSPTTDFGIELPPDGLPPPPVLPPPADSGFAGAAYVDSANLGAAVSVRGNQQANIELPHSSGTTTPPTAVTIPAGGGSGSSGSGAVSGGVSTPPPVIVMTGGVRITITTKK